MLAKNEIMCYNAPMYFPNKPKKTSVAPERTCCFTGNRPHKLPWGENELDPRCIDVKARMDDELMRLINEGYTLFISGMAQGGDTFFARAVLKLRESYPFIKLECAVPCPSQPNAWSDAQKAEYCNILERADYVTMVSPSYTRACMFIRNRYMVDNSSAIVTLCYDEKGGTASTVEYAQKNGLKVIKLVK